MKFILIASLFLSHPAFAGKISCASSLKSAADQVVLDESALRILSVLENELAADPTYGAFSLFSDESEQETRYTVRARVAPEFGDMSFWVDEEPLTEDEFGSGTLRISSVTLRLTRSQDQLLGNQKAEVYRTELVTASEERYEVQVWLQFISDRFRAEAPHLWLRARTALVFVRRI